MTEANQSKQAGRTKACIVFEAGSFLISQQPAGRRRNDGHADQHRNADRAGDGNRNILKQLPSLPLHKDHRHENHDHRQRGSKHCPPDLVSPLQSGFSGRLAHLEMAIDILQHRDRVVCHHPHSERHPGQTDDINTAAKQLHKNERGNDADRNGKSDNEHRSHALQKQQQNYNRQHSTRIHIAFHQCGC